MAACTGGRDEAATRRTAARLPAARLVPAGLRIPFRAGVPGRGLVQSRLRRRLRRFARDRGRGASGRVRPIWDNPRCRAVRSWPARRAGALLHRDARLSRSAGRACRTAAAVRLAATGNSCVAIISAGASMTSTRNWRASSRSSGRTSTRSIPRSSTTVSSVGCTAGSATWNSKARSRGGAA